MAKIQNLEALKASLSAEATLDVKGDENYAVSAARWSDLNTPKPGVVVNVSSEGDIVAAVSSPLHETLGTGDEVARCRLTPVFL